MSILRNGVHYYERISNDAEAFAVRPAKGQKRGVVLLTHGIGERSAGGIENLINLIDGFDYDGAGPLPRQYAFENDTIEAFAAKYDFHLVTVTYPDSFEPNDYTYVLDSVIRDFSVDITRLYIVGFSLGGGAILKGVTSSVAFPSRLAGAIAAAPVNWATVHKNVVDANLQVIGTTCEVDKTVSPANIKDFVTKVNAYKPKLPAVLIIYKGTAHSGFNEIMAEENTWKWMAANSNTNRIAFTRPDGISNPSTPTPEPGVPDFNIANGQVITTSEFELDASASQGATSYYWKVDRAEAPWTGPNWVGGTVGGPKKKITGLMNGLHTVQLEINGAIKSPVRTFVVRLSGEPEPKKLIEATGSIVRKYSDGSTDTAKVSVVDGKLVVE